MGLKERLQDCKEAVVERWLEDVPWLLSERMPPERPAAEEEQNR